MGLSSVRRWAYEFCLSQDELVKWELRRLYHRRQAYYTAHGFPDFPFLREMMCGPSLQIEVTTSLFQAQVRSEDGSYTWNIREDGLVWKEKLLEPGQLSDASLQRIEDRFRRKQELAQGAVPSCLACLRN